MNDPTRALVAFRKQLSDGNYGTEACEVTLEVPLEDGSDSFSEESIVATLQTARRLVHEELGRSPSSNIRRALEPPRPLPRHIPTGEEAPDEVPF